MSHETSPSQADSDLPSGRVFPRKLLTTREVMKRFNVAERTVRDWINRGELIAVKFGKQHFISEQALEESWNLKEDAKRLEVRRQLHENERRAELRRRQDADPLPEWDIKQCIECGVEPVFCDRFDRETGRVLCPACTERGNFQLSAVAYCRQAALITFEKNRRAEQRKQPADWFIYECVICERPIVLTERHVLDQDFYPRCDHDRPFSPTYRSSEEEGASFDYAVIAELARLEAQFRNARENVEGGVTPPWRVYPCAACRLGKAVATLDRRLVGTTKCRACHITKKEPSFYSRSDVIADALKEFGAGRFSDQRCDCEVLSDCPRVELTEDATKEVVLSWCRKRPEAERLELARKYCERFVPGLVAEYSGSLIIQRDPLGVSDPPTASDLEDLPF